MQGDLDQRASIGDLQRARLRLKGGFCIAAVCIQERDACGVWLHAFLAGAAVPRHSQLRKLQFQHA